MNRISTMATILASHPGVSATAQRQRLLTALLTMGNVTTYEASRHLDLYDPRARKHELVVRGYDIETVLELVQTECGAHHRIGRYVLKAIPQEAAA